jgi:hypothetical protein
MYERKIVQCESAVLEKAVEEPFPLLWLGEILFAGN